VDVPSTPPNAPRLAQIRAMRAGEGPVGVASGIAAAGRTSRGHTSTSGRVGCPRALLRGALTGPIWPSRCHAAGRRSVDGSTGPVRTLPVVLPTGGALRPQPSARLPCCSSLRRAPVDEVPDTARIAALLAGHSRKGPALRLLDEREPDAWELHAGEDDQDEDEQEQQGSEAVVHGYTLPSLRARGRSRSSPAGGVGRECRRGRRRRPEPVRARGDAPRSAGAESRNASCPRSSSPSEPRNENSVVSRSDAALISPAVQMRS